MTIGALLRNNYQLPVGEAEILLCFILKKDKTFLFAHPEYRLSPIAYFKFRYFTWQRRRGLPIAYITHHKEFYGINFFVNKHTLVPRPETEMMVESVLEEIKKSITATATASAGSRLMATTGSRLTAVRNQKINLIDVGTGSGCIPIAIASGIRQSGLSGYLDTIFATDISRRALKIAKKNARTQNVFIEFLRGNLLEPLLKEQGIWNKEQVIITANLPYLTQTQFDFEPSIQHEPVTALVAADQGLALYRQLLQQIASNLLIAHCSLLIFIEIDPSQSPLVTPLIHRYLPQAKVAIKPDLTGNNRLVEIWLDKSEKKA